MSGILPNTRDPIINRSDNPGIVFAKKCTQGSNFLYDDGLHQRFSSIIPHFTAMYLNCRKCATSTLDKH